MVLVDIVPDMEEAGAGRIRAFMTDRATDGFASLDEVVDAVAAYNPHRSRSDDLAGLRKNLRERDGRFYWHWDPRFIDVSGAGHMVAGDRNDAFTASVASFLQRHTVRTTI